MYFKDESVFPDSLIFSPTIGTKLPIRVYHEKLSLSTSFNLAKNAVPRNFSFFQFSEIYSVGLRMEFKQSELDFSLDSEIGYKYYLDSIWELTDDRFALSVFRFGSQVKKFRYTYSLQLNTSVLPSYVNVADLDDSSTKLKSGGLFNPGELSLAYGFAWSFWDFSFLNVSLATIKLQSSSKYIIGEDESDIGYFKREWIIDYGLSINLRVNHSLSKRLLWLNQSRFFFNSLDKNKLRLSINNQLEFKLIRSLKLITATRIEYFPVIQSKIQIRQEFRLGFEWIFSP